MADFRRKKLSKGRNPLKNQTPFQFFLDGF